MNPIKQTNIFEPVIYIQILDAKTLLIVDSHSTLKYFDKTSMYIKNNIKISNLHKRYATKVVALNYTVDRLALVSTGAKNSKLIDIKNKKVITTIDRHQGEVSCVAIDPKNKYMFSCGDDGKTFAIDINTGALMFTLPIHIDGVNDIAFSQNGQWLATGSYDKNIFLFNLATVSPKSKLKAHSSAVVKLQFLSNHRLFSVDKKNSAIIWDLNTSKIITRLKGIHDDVTCVVVGSDNNFLFLGTQLGYVIVFDLKIYELISAKLIKFTHKITAINFIEETQELIVASDSGELKIYNIFENEDKLNESLRKKDYFHMQKYMDANPLLKYTKASQVFIALWDRTIEKATQYLGDNNKKQAIKLFENFKDISSKKQAMLKLIKEFDEFDKFLMFIEKKKLPLAYSLANMHPVYKKTSVYKNMEIKWIEALNLAKKYFFESKFNDKATELLVPYRGISEKTKIIQQLVLKSKLYRRFQTAAGQKDFKIVSELLKQHSFLKRFKEYDALVKYSDSLYIKIQKYLQKDDTHSAIKLLRVLVDFEDFKEEAKIIMTNIENRQKFFNTIQDNDLILAYNLLDSSNDLQSSESGKKLHLAWENDLNIANMYAQNKDIDGIKTTLNKYIKISSKNRSIAIVLSKYYIVELELKLKQIKDKKILEHGIKNYLLYFGSTDEIMSFFEIFKEKFLDTKLNLKSQVHGSMDKWRPSMIVNSILD
ncbi:MAG: WD40 repeat domain-containing protein [Sulfurimonas sp.]|nr:WD40 repeat domain-containing protein [Sulfurimonas sp.]